MEIVTSVRLNDSRYHNGMTKCGSVMLQKVLQPVSKYFTENLVRFPKSPVLLGHHPMVPGSPWVELGQGGRILSASLGNPQQLPTRCPASRTPYGSRSCLWAMNTRTFRGTPGRGNRPGERLLSHHGLMACTSLPMA